MPNEAKDWWETHGRSYQDTCRIPIDVLYGTGGPNEDSLQLIGPVAGKRLLEIGCGGAQASIAFARQGAVVTAIDVASSEIEFARELAQAQQVSIEFQMVEPDSRQRYPYDPWYGLWGNTPENLRLFPATIIFK